jgi:hypothetical protein
VSSRKILRESPSDDGFFVRALYGRHIQIHRRFQFGQLFHSFRQLYQGQRTHIGWTAREIVLPTIAESPGSGAIIKVAGITGRIRGMKYKRADGQTVRPSLVILDDPQTDESARSLSQCATRESILAGAVLGLAGPGKKISGIMPCTVNRVTFWLSGVWTDWGGRCVI